MVDGLHRLRHDAVVGRDHQDRDVGGLRTTGTHGGERLVTRGVDEGDRSHGAVELDLDLVSADVLGDAAGLALADGGVADGVQQAGLAVVDVTHDGDHRRTDLEVLLATLVLAVGEVEGLQQLAVFVLGRDDLHLEVHLAAEQLQRVVTDRLGRGDHLTEVEQRLDECGRVGVDLLGEVAQRRATGQPDGLAVALGQPHTTDDGRLHVLVFGAFRPLRLAAALRGTAGTTERTCRATALAGTATAATTTGATAETTATCGCATTAAGAAAAVVTATAATGARTLPGTAGTGATAGTRTGTWAAPPRRTGSRRTRRHVAGRRTRAAAGTRRTRTRLRPRDGTLDRLLRREGVVADARGTRGRLRAARCRARTRAGRGTRGRPGSWRGARGGSCLGAGRRGCRCAGRGRRLRGSRLGR